MSTASYATLTNPPWATLDDTPVIEVIGMVIRVLSFSSRNWTSSFEITSDPFTFFSIPAWPAWYSTFGIRS